MTIEPIGGGAVDWIVKKVAEEDVGTLPLTSLAGTEGPVGFVNEVMSYLRGWIEAHSSRNRTADPPTIFLACERPRVDAEALGGRPVPMFQIDRSQTLGGLVLASARLNNVAVVPEAASTLTLQELHTLVLRIGAGERPAVVFFPNDLRIVVCRDGVAGEESYIELTLSELAVGRISEETVDSLLTDYHRFWLSTPSCPVRVWKNRDYFVPIREPEIEIERWLVPVARFKFKASIIVKELALLSGRADVALLPRPGAGDLGSAVIELKVLKSKSYSSQARSANDYPPSRNVEGVKDGIEQAAAYRDELDAELALLACFDLRKDVAAETVTNLQSEADAKTVKLRHYAVFNSSRSMRRAASARPRSNG
jgi:hypothetical protein